MCSLLGALLISPALGLLEVAGDAEVDELRGRIVLRRHEEDVLWLDVSVDDVPVVAIPQQRDREYRESQALIPL